MHSQEAAVYVDSFNRNIARCTAIKLYMCCQTVRGGRADWLNIRKLALKPLQTLLTVSSWR